MKTEIPSVRDLIDGAEIAAAVMKKGTRGEQQIAAVMTAFSVLAIAKMIDEMTYVDDHGQRVFHS